MVRSFAACLGCIAMISQIALGIAMGVETETILVQSVIALLIASAVGWVIGKLADELVRDMIETPTDAETSSCHRVIRRILPPDEFDGRTDVAIWTSERKPQS